MSYWVYRNVNILYAVHPSKNSVWPFSCQSELIRKLGYSIVVTLRTQDDRHFKINLTLVLIGLLQHANPDIRSKFQGILKKTDKNITPVRFKDWPLTGICYTDKLLKRPNSTHVVSAVFIQVPKSSIGKDYNPRGIITYLGRSPIIARSKTANRIFIQIQFI